MNVEAFLLCDCATDQNGKMNILGAFDTLFFKEMPGVFKACSIAARVRFEKIETGDETILEKRAATIARQLLGN